MTRGPHWDADPRFARFVTTIVVLELVLWGTLAALAFGLCR